LFSCCDDPVGGLYTLCSGIFCCAWSERFVKGRPIEVVCPEIGLDIIESSADDGMQLTKGLKSGHGRR
jgi:hypothetical protein